MAWEEGGARGAAEERRPREEGGAREGESGRTRLSEARQAEVVAVLQEGIAHHPTEIELYLTLGHVLERRGEGEAALRVYRSFPPPAHGGLNPNPNPNPSPSPTLGLTLNLTLTQTLTLAIVLTL